MNSASAPHPDWAPFRLLPEGERAEPPRSIKIHDGVGDRMRAAAFAEIQARDAFLWAADRTDWDVPESLRRAWRALAQAEDRHLHWLLNRMKALGFDITERPVSTQLWDSLTSCNSPGTFAHAMAGAEERGRRAGERFEEALRERDPETARIFGEIAEEEVAHIQLAWKYFPAPEEKQELA